MPKLAPWMALLLGAACGSGDKGPTGPGGGGTASYELVSIGQVGLPADLQLEDCSPVRFYGGGLEVHEDGTWEINLEGQNATGDWGYLDRGEIDDDGDTVWFDSEFSGDSYPGTANGTEVTIMYDWCHDGVTDMQLVFAR